MAHYLVCMVHVHVHRKNVTLTEPNPVVNLTSKGFPVLCAPQDFLVRTICVYKIHVTDVKRYVPVCNKNLLNLMFQMGCTTNIKLRPIPVWYVVKVIYQLHVSTTYVWTGENNIQNVWYLFSLYRSCMFICLTRQNQTITLILFFKKIKFCCI